MYDEPVVAWKYTQDRELETGRGISKESFIHSCKNIPINLRKALTMFGKVNNFEFNIVIQKGLRDKNYRVVSDRIDIDKIIDKVYNLDEIRKSL
jgi:hypothetical protein